MGRLLNWTVDGVVSAGVPSEVRRYVKPLS